MKTEPCSNTGKGSQVADLISSGVAKRSKGNYVHAYEDLTLALHYARSISTTFSEAMDSTVLDACIGEINMTIRDMFTHNVEKKKAADYSSVIVETIREIGNEFSEFELRHRLVTALQIRAMFYEFEDFDSKKALPCYQEAFNLLKQLKTEQRLVEGYENTYCGCLDGIARQYEHLCEYDKAIASWQDLVTFAKEKAAEDDRASWQDRIGKSLYSIADSYNLANKRDVAITYAKESVEIWQKLNDELRTQESGAELAKALELLQRIYRNLAKETEEKLLAVKSVNEAMWGKEKWVWDESNTLAKGILQIILEQVCLSFALYPDREALTKTVVGDFKIFLDFVGKTYKNQGMFTCDFLKESMPDNRWLTLWMEITKRNSGGDTGNAQPGSSSELLLLILRSSKTMTKANPDLLDKLRKKKNIKGSDSE